MSPYQDALNWIQRHPTTGSATALAKMVLSLWNADCCFSFAECVRSLDAERTALAVRMCQHYGEHGEDPELVRIGHVVCTEYPRLWDLGMAATRAKGGLRRQWEEEDRAALDDGDDQAPPAPR